MDSVVTLRHYSNNEALDLYQGKRNTTDPFKITLTHICDPATTNFVEVVPEIEVSHLYNGVYSQQLIPDESCTGPHKGTYLDVNFTPNRG